MISTAVGMGFIKFDPKPTRVAATKTDAALVPSAGMSVEQLQAEVQKQTLATQLQALMTEKAELARSEAQKKFETAKLERLGAENVAATAHLLAKFDPKPSPLSTPKKSGLSSNPGSPVALVAQADVHAAAAAEALEAEEPA
jgi:hypothetical protein